jgi:RNA polymerase sigma factor (TIGR02999 family)
MPLVYEELRRLARQRLRRERAGHTLQATALVNEAYLRLVDQTRVSWRSRGHFFAVAAQQMRRILVDYARAHAAAKRQGGNSLSLDQAATFAREQALDLVALDEALDNLSRSYPRKSQVVELKFFGGLEVREIAGALEVSEKTVRRDWHFAKLWLLRELSGL